MKATPAKEAKATIYRPRGLFEAFVLRYIKQSPLSRIGLGEVRTAYSVEHGKVQRSTATRSVRRLARLGLLEVRSYEQLWLKATAQTYSWHPEQLLELRKQRLRREIGPRIKSNGLAKNESNANAGAWPSPQGDQLGHSPLLRSHRFRFAAVAYSGAFIENESTWASGKYGHIKTTKFKLGGGAYTIVMHAHRIAIWIHDSQGKTVEEQRKDAEQKAADRLALFAHGHALELHAHDFRKINGSEHTVEDKGVDEILQPMILQEPEFFDQQLGMAVNASSHKDKSELHERNRETSGPQFPRSQRFQYVLDEFPVKVLPAMTEAISSNAGVNKNINALLSELVGQVKALRQEQLADRILMENVVKRIDALELKG